MEVDRGHQSLLVPVWMTTPEAAPLASASRQGYYALIFVILHVKSKYILFDEITYKLWIFANFHFFRVFVAFLQ